MMQLLQVGIFAYNISNLLLHLFGQAMLREFAYSISKQPSGRQDDEDAYHASRNRVKHRPFVAQYDSAPNTDSRADRRECIRAMMPCVSSYSFGFDAFCHTDSQLIYKFF